MLGTALRRRAWRGGGAAAPLQCGGASSWSVLVRRCSRRRDAQSALLSSSRCMCECSVVSLQSDVLSACSGAAVAPSQRCIVFPAFAVAKHALSSFRRSDAQSTLRDFGYAKKFILFCFRNKNIDIHIRNFVAVSSIFLHIPQFRTARAAHK